ncbi:MAG: hypothetical protein RIR11_2924 [Bacteroidota bacterium]|jgi:hypothetical protein
MTFILIVLNLLINSYTTVITNESGKTQIQNSTEFIIINDEVI